MALLCGLLSLFFCVLSVLGIVWGLLIKILKKLRPVDNGKSHSFFTFRLQVFQPRLQFLQAVRSASIATENQENR